MALIDSLIIELDSIDSTNNYAMQLIDANKALQGMTIIAQSQWAGKGQRGKTWIDAPGQSLLMSVITLPKLDIMQQFVFSASVAVAIANILTNLNDNWHVQIKWPNDIIINDKKAGGILIENVLRGSQWTHSVIGLGLNIKQESFPESLPHATSLRLASGRDYNFIKIRDEIREQIMICTLCPHSPEMIMERYNLNLYKRGRKQRFKDGNGNREATILNAHTDGTLEVEAENGAILFYHHGQVAWEW